MVAAYVPTKNWSDDAPWTDVKADAFADDLASYINSTLLAALPDKTTTDAVAGAWTFDNLITFTGGVAITTQPLSVSSTASFNGAVTFGATVTFSAAVTFSGSNVFSGTNTFSGVNTFSAINIFSANQRFNDGRGFVDANGNEYLKFAQTAAAVNELTIRNSATGVSPSLEATGDDANLNVLLVPKGSGVVKHGTMTLLREDGFTSDTDTGAETLGDAQAAFIAVDATNAAITFTAAAPGKYFVYFTFNVNMADTGADTPTVSFRLTDGTANGPILTLRRFQEGGNQTVPVTLVHVFTFASSGAKTITLQYRTATTNGANTSVAFNDQTTLSSDCGMGVFRVAD